MVTVTVHILQGSSIRLREAKPLAQGHTASDAGLEPKDPWCTEDSGEQRECSQTPPCAPLGDLLSQPLHLGSNLIRPISTCHVSFMVCVL